MKNTRFYLMLGMLLLTLIACEKENNNPTPIPESIPSTCSNCSCVGLDTIIFQDTVGNNAKSFNNLAYSPVFYNSSLVGLQGRYVDYSAQGNAWGGYCQIAPLTPLWQGQNPNFSGSILYIEDADVKFNYDGSFTNTKIVSFDVNKPLGAFNFKINGLDYNLANNKLIKTTGLDNGYHIEISRHIIHSLELGGEDLAVDNICVKDQEPNSLCISFTDSSFLDSCAITQTTYGAPFYALLDLNPPLKLRTKYTDYGSPSGLAGYIYWGISQTLGTGQHVAFSAELLEVSNCDLEFDISAFAYRNKRVSFDIANTWNIVNANEFNINNAGLGTLPTGVTFNLMYLGIAGNGSPCYRVIMEGPIDSFVLKGWETTYDNLCIEAI